MTSKFKFFAAALVLGVFALVASASAATYTWSSTLKQGSTGPAVMNLQKFLNMWPGTQVSTSGAGAPGMETSTFGPATKAAVIRFQVANGLTADGVFGPASAAKAVALQASGSTGGSNLPAGCVAGAMFSSTTGASCTGGSTTTVSGNNAGTLELSATSTDVEDDVEEGATEKVVGVEAQAEDSDIAITNVKVEIEATTTAYSTRIEKYLDSVSVWLGDKKVGEVDADSFSKNGNVYTKTISVSGAVVKEDDEENLYVGVTALDSVDDDAQTFDVSITDTRYTDGTGAILSVSDDFSNTFGFDEEGVDDELTVRSSSANPDATTLKVDEDVKSDDYMVLAFNLDVDEDSSDITVNELPIHFTLSTGTFSKVINEVYVKVGSKEYDADRDALASATTGTYTVDFNDDFVIDAGDQEEVKVYVVFNKQTGNYSTGATISANVVGTEIDAEGADDLTSSNLSGTASGKTHTLEVDAPMISLVSKSFALAQSIDGVTTGTEDIFEAKFTFKVAADDETVYLPFTSGVASNSIIGFTKVGGTNIQSIIIDPADDDIEESASYEIADEEQFTVTFTLRGNDAANSITITSFGLSNDQNASADFQVTGGLTDFKSGSKYLAK